MQHDCERGDSIYNYGSISTTLYRITLCEGFLCSEGYNALWSANSRCRSRGTRVDNAIAGLIHRCVVT